ncbi:GTPase activating protein (GAP) for Rho1p [Elasticomyces elasticus]|nr:GTPase activating protein (GAP) for Rho1p [Elasticomyces elasticus]KAK3666897.1 GTPase activating protein (GAP) for Rho1p [Elasticomyces elasticus]KAK4933401.1 GTPase activating protein (GAP) for Rho1p [Elasticomyces elasticus]KAK5755507.1 GTPase activating protein (GAP) for Rho1p [Elasticomyces elasticus]
MPEPITVAASVAGLISSASTMIPILYNVGTSIRDAPQLTKEVAGELANITVVLQQLFAYISGKARASIERLNLITVEHITATLTDCVVTYSDLDAVLKSLRVDTGMRAWDRGMWYIKKGRVGEIVQKLQNHKASLGLMLNILQCASLSEAETSMDRLCDTVNELLRTNHDLSLRLRNMEDLRIPRESGIANEAHHDLASGEVQDEALTQSGAIDEENNTNLDDTSDAEVMTERPESVHEHEISTGEGIHQDMKYSHFEEMLHRSRVYRHVSDSDYSPSLISDARSTLAFSICSSLTLGEVSNISVYAIAVYAIELSNAICYESSVVGQHIHGSTRDSTTPAEEKKVPAKRGWRSFYKKTTKADIVPAAENRIFGVALETSMRYANVAISLYDDQGQQYIYGYIPIVLAKCTVFLKEKAVAIENFFATAGSPKRIKELTEVFDRPPRYGKGFDWTGYTVHDAAQTILRYLLQLPEPIIPLGVYERFREPLRAFHVAADGSGQGNDLLSPMHFDLEASIKHWQVCIAELSALRRQALLYLLDMLAVFVSRAETNAMTTQRLAALFQPGILAHPQHALSRVAVNLSQAVLAQLFENQDSFLVGALSGSEGSSAWQVVNTPAPTV